MGAEPWTYWVPYESDVRAALQKLRQSVFESGRYYPANAPRAGDPNSPRIREIVRFGLAFASRYSRYGQPDLSGFYPEPGTAKTIQDAVRRAGATGTRSILDIDRVSARAGSGIVVPLTEIKLVSAFGTDKPTRAIIEAHHGYSGRIERGQGVYTVVYDDQGQPSEWFFAGYSYD